MIPILYEANETAFATQGLGALADAVSVSVSRVINGKDELTMIYPSTGIRYADLANDRIVYVQPEYRKSAQPYQIYKITRPMNGLVTVYARHVGSQRTAFIPVTPFTAGSLTETLNSLPSHLAETSPFSFWTNKTVTANFSLTKPASLGKVLGGMEGSILDVYGGEYEYDGYAIKLWGRRGVDSGVELRYGKNITDIEQSEDFGSIITGVVPYWEGMDGTIVSLPEVVIEGQYADAYSFRRTIVKDFTESFQDQPTEADLRAAAQRYVAQSRLGVPEVNLKVSFEHLAQYTGYENLQLLETLNLGDTVSIFYEPLDVSATARIAKTVYDCLQEKYTSVQIGSVRSDLEQIMHTVSATAAQMKETLQQNLPSALAEAVENATDLITGANGGYVVLDRDANGKPFQILIMDTDDKATATNVLRLNQNGIGFSTSGYSGPFSTAWTIDSNFIADFITAGTLNAALAKIGVLADAAGKNSWNMVTGAFDITDGSINITTASETYDVIKFQNNEWKNAFSPLEYRVWNTDLEKAVILQASGQFYYDDYVENSSNTLRLLVHQGGVVAYDENGVKRQALTGTGKLQQYDQNEKLRTYLEYGDIHLYDAANVDRTHLNSEGKFWQYDSNGKKRTYLEYGDVFLYNSAEKQTVQLSASAYTTGGSLRLYDTSEVERVRETVDGLSFYNASGQARLRFDGTNANMFVLSSSGAEQVKIRSSGDSSWNTGRYYASLISKVQPADMNRYHPVVSVKGYSSDWSIGTLSNHLYFVNTTDSAYNNGRNYYLKYELEYADTSGGAQSYSILTTKNTTDRVIAHGSSGVWRYRKWASGWLECWGTIAIASKSFSAWGTGYYSPEVGYIDYPVAFSGAPYEVATPLSGSAWVSLMSSDHQQTATKCGGYRAYRPVSGNASFGVEIYAMGTAAS